ncbi:hypothetical protein HGI30_00330 [Paenibacillus albicereus]|uniref:Uncharacterized protein n=1 Tax=Paenibacillus albicereus TaxID=2726185 RepID=A0A6H2GST2_9BACL|nr:hypothetical protein [Paenibacillus albicereus]QJC50208.1 hypothetical protein HGI30_00330 [Paenibacillus albicereus]
MKEDKGSSLLLVVFLILLLSLLGVAVLGASLGGAMRTERSEENVQSVHLAQKGLDEAIAAIYDRFNGRLIEPESLGAQLAGFTEAFNAQLADAGKGGSEIDAARPFYQVVSVRCADDGKCLSRGSSGSAAYQYSLVVTAEAEVDGAKRRLQQEVMLDTYPDFLKYAFGSEGVVTIGGAPYFRGSLYAGEALQLSDTAEYVYLGARRTQVSQFPYLDPMLGEDGQPQDDSGWIIAGDGGRLHYGYGISYPDGVDRYMAVYDRSLAAADGVDRDKTHGLGQRIRVEPPQKFVSIDVRSSFLDKVRDSLGDGAGRQDRSVIESVYASGGPTALIGLLESSYPSRYAWLGAQPVLTAEEPPVPDILLGPEPSDPGESPPEPSAPNAGPDPAAYEQARLEYEEAVAVYEQAVADYEEELGEFRAGLASIGASGQAGSAVVTGPLVLDGSVPAIDFASKGKHNWLIVHGDLELRGPAIGATSGDGAAGEEAGPGAGGVGGGEGDADASGPNGSAGSDSSPLRLRGNVLVTGSMTLTGQVDVDATVYVLGRTDIRDGAIRGLQPGGTAPRKELVLIGGGPIDLYRVSSFQPVGAGYGSGTEADGQVLDAFLYTESSAGLYGVGSAFWMRGGFFAKGDLTLNATLGSTAEDEARQRLSFPEQSSLGKEKARFIIDYNSSVFASQEAALPRVNKVRLTTGPLRLLPQGDGANG